MNMLAYILVFILLVVAIWITWRQYIRQQVRNRLARLLSTTATSEPISLQAAPKTSWKERLDTWLESIAKLAQSGTEDAWEQSPERQRFWHAGLYQAEAPLIYFAAKTILCILLPSLVVFWRYLDANSPFDFVSDLFYVLAAAYVGYLLPEWALRHLIERRQRDLFESFPDALDLITICVEAGLAIDAALQRVGQEIRMKSETLSQELRMVTLELRAGSTRERALRNLAARTGLPEINTLAAMLIQADRFGTSIAVSLRIHAETLRQTRKQRAEEAAAKIPTKLLFPLVFCIFPSLLLVLLGPAFISIYRTMGTMK